MGFSFLRNLVANLGVWGGKVYFFRGECAHVVTAIAMVDPAFLRLFMLYYKGDVMGQKVGELGLD
jgi:hypothetical protein